MHVPPTTSEILRKFCAKQKNSMASAVNGQNCAPTSVNSQEVKEMFVNIANSKAIIKSQQRGEPDLTLDEKIVILKELFNYNKVTFMYKFGSFLRQQDLDLFLEPDNYEITFYLNKLRKELDPDIRFQAVKNRRYNYLHKVLKKTDYFSDKELQNRDPLLYRQYIEQYKSKEQITQESNSSLATQTFSQFLFGTIDKDLNNFRCELELEAQEEQEEEEDEDSEVEDEDLQKYIDEKVPITQEERDRFRVEFVELMENRFLDGNDDFDYSLIDDNEEYDDYQDQDMEDKYFEDG